MYFQHLQAKKVKLNDLATMQHYLITQESRSEMNHSIEDLSPAKLSSRVKARIAQLHLKRRPRSDAVGIEDIMVGTSAEFMQNMGKDLREQYFFDALHFFQNYYGKENVLYCQYHLGEDNPHIHVGIMPVTPDGRLSASNLFAAKSLKVLRTAFHREVASRYGLAQKRSANCFEKYLELCNFRMERLKFKLESLLEETLDVAQVNQMVLEQKI